MSMKGLFAPPLDIVVEVKEKKLRKKKRAAKKAKAPQ